MPKLRAIGVLAMTVGMTPLTAAAAAAEEADANLFAGTFAQSLAAIISFVILLLLLRKYAWGPILQGLQAREAKIKADLQQAERAAQEASATLEQYKQQLAEARKEAQQIVAQSRQDAQRVADQLKQQAQEEIGHMRQRAEADITTAKEQAIAELYERTAELATQVAGQILEREVSASEHAELVRQSLGRLEQAVRN